jgi:hypothetical protein
MEAIMGAMLLAFGMAEPKRRGYGESDIYFDQPRRLPGHGREGRPSRR